MAALCLIPTGISAGILEDYDPLTDIVVTVEVSEIRALAIIDSDSAPDFFVRVRINSDEFQSSVWVNTTDVQSRWNASLNVPDDQAMVAISLSLYDAGPGGDRLCDICSRSGSSPEGYGLNLVYDVRTGRWDGGDAIWDPSGYGRANGADDQGDGASERDCELWFQVRQTDVDGDGIPYWAETTLLHTDPLQNDSGTDPDGDGASTGWEYRWGYDPFAADDHQKLDPDDDGVANLLEQRLSAWASDPFRRDVFLEVDVMQGGPGGESNVIPHGAFERLRDPFAVHDIVVHVDDGAMGGGGEILPYDDEVSPLELKALYQRFFLHENPATWRRDVFRWCASLHYHPATGMAFVGERAFFNTWHKQGINSFELSSVQISKKFENQSSEVANFTYASAMMHELGHTFGLDLLFPLGCDLFLTAKPGSLAYRLFVNYRSCMNYRYVYKYLDYSDGSHGFLDHDDWGGLDFDFFHKRS